MPPALNSIDDAIESLQTIVDDSVAQSSTLGYFPALYLRVTREIKRAIDEKRFDDNGRMETLDIKFAQRYLDAFRARQTGQTCPKSWNAAFDNENNLRLVVLQHLLLGMNAHISYDLGISAAEVADGDPLPLKRDFLQINEILAGQINGTQARLTRIFRPLGIVDNLLGPIDEQISLFSIRYARDKAWTQALELAQADATQGQAILDDRDAVVSKFSSRLAQPNRLSIRLLLGIVRLLEKGNIPTRIRICEGAI